MTPPKQVRSHVWRSFRHYSGSKNRVQCLLCSKLIAFTGSTSNLSRHLQNHSSIHSRKQRPVQRLPQEESATDVDEAQAAVDQLVTGDDAKPVDDSKPVDDAEPVDDMKPPPSKRNPLRTRHRSNVWVHFDRNGKDKRAQCQLCSSYFSFSGGSTGNLSRHLLLKHRIRVEAYWKSNPKRSATEPEVVTKLEEPDEDVEHYEEVVDMSEAVDDEFFSFGIDPPKKRKPAAQAKATIVWRYFVRLGESHVQCKLCTRTLVMQPNDIANMRYHLYSVHHDLMELEPKSDENAPNDESITHFDASHPVEGVTVDNIDMTVVDEAPVANFYVDSDGRLTTESSVAAAEQLPTADTTAVDAAPTSRPPLKPSECRKLDATLRRLLTGDLAAAAPPGTYSCPFQSASSSQHLTAKFQAVMQRIANALQQADFVALTAATWSARRSPGAPTTSSTVYLAITAHFIVRTDWRMHSVLLNCGRLASCDASDPTGASLHSSIAHHLRHACTFWGIGDKVFAIVTEATADPADSDADAFGEATALGWSRLQCLDRRLGVCITQALQVNEFEALRLKIRSIVELFETDVRAAAKLSYFQLQGDVAVWPGAMPLELPSWTDDDGGNGGGDEDDESVRWRQTLADLQRMCDLQVPLDAALEIQRHHTRLSTGDWMAVRDVRDLLQSLAGALAELRSGCDVSTSKAIVLMHGLNAQLAELRSSEYRTVVCKELAEHLQRNVLARMHDVECDLLLGVCTFLDPRFGRCGFVRPQALELCRCHVESLAASRPHGEREPQPPLLPPAKTTGIAAAATWRWLDEQVCKQQLQQPAGKVLAQRELRFYLEQTAIERQADPLQWWRTRGSVSCPRLAQLARKYLALPATCAPSKRALASAERLLQGGWRLGGQTMKMVLFLQENVEFYAGE